MTEGKERPKTLPLPSIETAPSDLFKKQSRPWCVEEQRKSDSVVRCHTPGDLKSSKGDKTPSCICDKTAISRTKGQCSNATDLRESVQNIKISNNRADSFLDDFELSVQKDKCGCGQTSLQVKYKNKGSQSAPTTPSSLQKSIEGDVVTCTGRKHRSSLNVDRSVRSPCTSEAQKPFTKVMLTLRPPSTEPQPSVSLVAKGSDLVYSTSSYDSKLGYKNELQISIDKEGRTTLSALRVKPNPSIPEQKPDDMVDQETFPSLLPAFENALSPTSECKYYYIFSTI